MLEALIRTTALNGSSPRRGMFTSREGVGLCTISSVQIDPDNTSSQQQPFAAHSAPAIASLSAIFDHFFRSLPWNQGNAALQPRTGAGAQTEPKTNTRFEGQFCQRGSSKCGDLAGVGVRSKKIAGIKSIHVYALGLYVDVPAARSALRSYCSKHPEALAKDQGFYDALVKADNVNKTLHMSITFGRISSQQFWEAIREQLQAPMAKAGANAELQQFAKTFDDVKFRKGLPLSFCISDDLLTSKIDGKEASAIKSRALCHSLLGVYLGKNPVSPDAKETIGTGLAAMLALE